VDVRKGLDIDRQIASFCPECDEWLCRTSEHCGCDRLALRVQRSLNRLQPSSVRARSPVVSPGNLTCVAGQRKVMDSKGAPAVATTLLSPSVDAVNDEVTLCTVTLTAYAVGLPHLQPAALDPPEKAQHRTSHHLREKQNSEENRDRLSK
jgi:hypothetical protein